MATPIRLSQAAIEVISLRASGLRLSQCVIEVIRKPNPPWRIQITGLTTNPATRKTTVKGIVRASFSD